MLLGFQVSNHRSFLDTAEFAMSAVDEDRLATRRFDRLSERVLTVAGIYGPNASGKSNLLNAIAWLSDAVRRSFRGWDEFVPRDPHMFGEGPATPSVFDMALVVDGAECEYRLEVDDSAVLYESLHSYPERRRRMLFERHDNDIRFRRGLARTHAAQDLLTETTLALSAATRLRMPDVEGVGRAVAGISLLGRGFRPPFHSLRYSTRRLFAGEDEGRQPTLGNMFGDLDRAVALDLLRWADPGINDVKFIEREERENPPRPGRRVRPGRQMQFVRHVADGEYPIDFSDESAGTQTWFRLLGPALEALRGGSVLLFDEIDASLHPRLSSQLIELFQDPDTNPHNAQLVFTTHDTSLLNVLNRDEVWLTEKGPDGQSSLTALAEYGTARVRKSLNLERAYLQGRFGAVPEVDQIAIRHALGLAVRGL